MFVRALGSRVAPKDIEDLVTLPRRGFWSRIPQNTGDKFGLPEDTRAQLEQLSQANGTAGLVDSQDPHSFFLMQFCVSIFIAYVLKEREIRIQKVSHFHY